jgi:GDP-L-fucose synthase
MQLEVGVVHMRVLVDVVDALGVEAAGAAFDATQPDGAPRKLMDSSRLNALGWQAQVNLEQGLALAYQDFMTQAKGAQTTAAPL